MNLKKAINIRHSRRKFLESDIAEEIKVKLEGAIWECNTKTGLNIQLITNDKEPFKGFKSTYGIISGASNYIALVGKKDSVEDEEKLGYFGESLVLLATMLGLGTCWVGGTYDKEKCSCKINEDEELKCIIILGNVSEKTSIKEKILTKAAHKKEKKIKDMLRTQEEPPNWVIEGMESVEKAPSAMNKKPVIFYYSSGAISAKVSGEGSLDFFDLGIAKLHFELGAKKGSWEFGNSGIFIYEEQ